MTTAWPAADAAGCLASAWVVTTDLPLRALVVASLVAVLGWTARQRSFAGRAALLAMHASMLAWLVLAGFEHAATDSACKLTLALAQWPAIMAVAPLWVVFMRRYAALDSEPFDARAWLLVLLPVVAIAAVVATQGAHGWLYRSATTVVDAGGIARLRSERGAAFYAAAAWNYALLAWAFVIVACHARALRGPLRRHLLGFLAMMAVPWVANALYLGADWRPLGVDPTPLSFAVASVGFTLLVRHGGLFDAVPLAHRVLFDALPDAVLVVDRRGRVVAANAAAVSLAGVGGAAPLLAALADWPHIGAALAARLAGGDDAPLALADDRRWVLRRQPILRRARRLGTLLMLHDATDELRARDALETALAESGERLRQLQALQAELAEQALRDPLTGLWNRRALAARFDDVVARSPQAPLGVAVIDVDHFKQINDSHGHAAGDAVLQGLATVLLGQLRAGDALFRVGGEEFVLLMPGADAATLAQRLGAVQQRLRRRAMRAGAVDVDVRISAGVAARPEHGHTLAALSAAADRALYRAKRGGRDRVVVA